MPEDTATLIIACKNHASEEVERFTKSVKKADDTSAKLMKTMGHLLSTAALVKFGRDSVNAFAKQEQAIKSLDSAYARIGISNLAYRKELQKLNAELSSKTLFSGSQLAMVEAMGLNMGINADQIEKVTKAAVGMSAIYGKDLSTSMLILSRAANGNYTMLSRMGIQFDKNKPHAEAYAELLDKMTGGMKNAEAQTETLAGKMTQMGNSLSTAKGKIGEQLAPALKDVTGWVKDLADSFVKAEPETQRFVAVTGTVFTALTALKGISSANAIVQKLSGAEGVKASQQKSAAVANEIAMEKALQKEKLANIALDQARGNVTAARGALSAAEANRNTILASPNPNLDALSGADAKVNEAAAQLKQYEQQLTKAEAAALKASNAVQVLNSTQAQSSPVIQKSATELRNAVLSAQKNFESLTKERFAYGKKIDAVWGRMSKLESAGQTGSKEYAALSRMYERLTYKAEAIEEPLHKANMALKATKTDALAAGVPLTKLGVVGHAVGGKIQAGMTMAGTAIKGATAAAWGLAKAFAPMLAISAAFAAVDWLLNKDKMAAEKDNDIAKAYVDNIDKIIQKQKEAREEENRYLESLKAMSQYNSLTTSEQSNASEMISKLTTRYGDLAGAIQIVNGKLVIQKDFTEKLTAAQLKNYIQGQKEASKKAMEYANTMASGFYSNFYTYYTRNAANDPVMKNALKGFDLLFGTNFHGDAKSKESLIQKVSNGGLTADDFDKVALDARSKGFKDMADYAQKIADALRKADQHEKNIFEAQKAGTAPKGTGAKETTPSEWIKKLIDARSKIDEKSSSILFDIKKPEEQIKDLESQLQELKKKRDDALQRVNNPADEKSKRENELLSLQYSEKMIELEKQKSALMETSDQKRIDALKREADAQHNIFMSFSDSFNRFRETAQSAVYSNSEQAQRLQSRTFLSGGNGLQQAAKNAADAAKKAADATDKLNAIQSEMKRSIEEILSKIKEINVSSAG